MILAKSNIDATPMRRFSEKYPIECPFSSFARIFGVLFGLATNQVVAISGSKHADEPIRCSTPKAVLEGLKKSEEKGVGDPAFRGFGRPPLFQNTDADLNGPRPDQVKENHSA